MDWQMRILQQNILNVLGKSMAPGIRIFNALAPTALPMDYAAKIADTVPLIRNSQRSALDSSDSESETEPQNSGDEHSSSNDYSSAQTLIMLSSDDGTEAQSSTQSSSEQSSNAPTLIVSPSDDDTEVQSSIQSSEEGDQSIASRTRLQLARQRLTTIALPITHTDLNDPPSTSQFTTRRTKKSAKNIRTFEISDTLTFLACKATFNMASQIAISNGGLAFASGKCLQLFFHLYYKVTNVLRVFLFLKTSQKTQHYVLFLKGRLWLP
jgi:hypothetical protein